MEIALVLIGLAVAVLVVTGVAARVGVPAPFVLVVAGALASYLPGLPEVTLSPEVVLVGLLPPLLYSAAIQTSLVEFNANRRPILLLSVGLVVVTTLGVGVVVHALLPGVGWPAAFAIGAVVAPPDAVAALAIARRVGLPRRVVTILEGESLLNDATALVSLRTAIAAAGVSVSALEVGLDFLLAAGGGLAVGVLLHLVVSRVRRHVTDPAMDTAISFVVPFAAYVAAEELHASGVISVVVAGLLLGHQAPVVQTAQSRIAERTNWRSVAFVLENAVFLLIGLQTQRLLADVGRSELSAGRVVLVCLATLLAVVVLRLAWVFPARYLLVRPGPDASGRRPPWSYTFLIGWAGMRGVVTLAAAFVIPPQTPFREVLLLVAFTVVAGTLLIQGLSLPWIARRLRVPTPDPMEDALARAALLQQASAAGLRALAEAAAEGGEAEDDDAHGVREAVEQRVERRNFAAWERLNTTLGEESPSDRYTRLRLLTLEAERREVLRVRSTGTVPSEVVSEVLGELDVEESMLDAVEEERDEERAAAFAGAGAGACEHLRRSPARETGGGLVCEDCEPGERWVALRTCLSCGHVACCDSSPHRHATAHWVGSRHPVMQSAQAGERWRWCFEDHLTG